MSETGQPENRLGLNDVSDEISRVFFGKGKQSGRPNYSGYQPPSAGYGAPRGPLLDQSGVSLGGSLYRGMHRFGNTATRNYFLWNWSIVRLISYSYFNIIFCK